MRCVVAALSGSLQAGAVVYEPFEYDTTGSGSLGDGNQDGGTGFDGPQVSKQLKKV